LIGKVIYRLERLERQKKLQKLKEENEEVLHMKRPMCFLHFNKSRMHKEENWRAIRALYLGRPLVIDYSMEEVIITYKL